MSEFQTQTSFTLDDFNNLELGLDNWDSYVVSDVTESQSICLQDEDLKLFNFDLFENEDNVLMDQNNLENCKFSHIKYFEPSYIFCFY